jgi:hypothetical protein
VKLNKLRLIMHDPDSGRFVDLLSHFQKMIINLFAKHLLKHEALSAKVIKSAFKSKTSNHV